MPNEVSGLPVYSSKSDPWESYGHVHETGSLSIPCSQCQWVCLRAGGNRIPFTPNPGFCQQPFFQNPLGKPSKSPGTAKKAWRDSGSTGTRRNIIVRCQFIPKGLPLGLIKGDLLLALSVFNNALLDLEYAGSVSLWKTFLEIGERLIMRQTHMSLNRSLLFIVIVTSEMGHLLDLYKAQQQLLETTGATLSDEGSYPPARARSTLTVDLPSYWLQQTGSIGQGRGLPLLPRGLTSFFLLGPLWLLILSSLFLASGLVLGVLAL